MARCENWESALASYLDDAKKQSFEWGKFDCVSFAANWILLCTGKDHMRGLRGKYRTAQGAQRLISKLGASNLREAVNIVYGDEIQNIAHAHRGDIAIVMNTGMDGVCGIVGTDGRHILVPSTGGGITPYPMYQAVCAWSVE